MSDSRYDELIFEFIEFIFSIGERLINVCVSCLIIYCISYILFRYIIFGNNKAQFEEFAESISSGFKDAAGAFKNAMPAVKEMAKCWAEAKMASLKCYSGFSKPTKYEKELIDRLRSEGWKDADIKRLLKEI